MAFLVPMALVFSLIGARPASAAGPDYGPPAAVCYESLFGPLGYIELYANYERLVTDDPFVEYLTFRPFVKDVVTGKTYNNYPWAALKRVNPGDIFPDPFGSFAVPYVIDDLPLGHYYLGAHYAWNRLIGNQYTGWTTRSVWVPTMNSAGQPAGFYLTQDGERRSRCDTQPYSVTVNYCGNFCLAQPSNSTSAQARVRELSQRALAIESPPVDKPSTAKVPAGTSQCSGKRPTIVGTEGADVLVGTMHGDVILGLGGDDTIFGGGGHGADFICAGDGADGVLGSAGRDYVAGGSGDDVLLGESGPDILKGEDGIDYVEPGPGSDRLDGGGSPLDILSYLSSSSAVGVDFSGGSAAGEGSDRFSGFNAVVGSNRDDSLIGSIGQELFVPVGGNDSVDGGPDSDAVLFTLSGQGVNVNLPAGSSLGEGADTLAGVEVVSGTTFDDVIVGDSAYNWLSGDEGSDQLDGLAGDDTLDAGAGVDVCVNGVIYVECENQGGNLFSTPPDPGEPEALG